MTARELTPDGHTTSPPPRYTEPSLGQGAGGAGHRPPVHLLVDRSAPSRTRGYVWKQGRRTGAVLGRLRRGRAAGTAFRGLVDYDFTAALEDELDGIAAGRQERTEWLSGFYFGGDGRP